MKLIFSLGLLSLTLSAMALDDGFQYSCSVSKIYSEKVFASQLKKGDVVEAFATYNFGPYYKVGEIIDIEEDRDSLDENKTSYLFYFSDPEPRINQEYKLSISKAKDLPDVYTKEEREKLKAGKKVKTKKMSAYRYSGKLYYKKTGNKSFKKVADLICK